LVFGIGKIRSLVVEILILRRFFSVVWHGTEEYEPVIAEWVEEVLKRGVSSTSKSFGQIPSKVEEVLKRGVSSTRNRKNRILREVEEVLKRKVVSNHGQNTPATSRWKRFSIINYNLYERKIKTNYIQKVRPRFGSG
jgi:hypothetical protein